MKTSHRVYIALLIVGLLVVAFWLVGLASGAEIDTSRVRATCLPVAAQAQTVHPSPYQLVPPVPLVGRDVVIIKNTDDVSTIYVGGDIGITQANGYPLGPGESLELPVGPAPVYVVGSGLPIEIRVLEYAACGT